ncbi:YmfQ family protein [Clostridium botulinum]|uniref:YmfQ family protein n=1 Tax=Clostridium botulinum TaxID=1491 RepID=UPI0004D44EA2|nr:YmfQ family protein [Clostridium botulinum]KEH96188.1 putative phage protein [Clostridium botulinum D str. 16868]
MITSPKGKEMIKQITPMYQDSKIEKAIYQAIGNEFDNAEYLINELLLQLFPQTATWGLVLWEQRVGLNTNLSETLEQRRRKVITKLQTRYPITPLAMANILKSYTGADINIVENVSPYTFKIKLTGKEGFPSSLNNLYKKGKKIKPSHLSVEYDLISITQSKIFLGTCMTLGEEITVYPWSPQNIQSIGSVNLALGNNTGTEEITVYPKGDD